MLLEHSQLIATAIFLSADTGNLAIREITYAAAVASVTLTPNTFTFPNEPTGGSSAPEIFTLTNNSSAQVTAITIDFTGGATPPDFTQTSTCATALDAGSSCTISVVFSPQAAGNRFAALHVADSDPASPQTAALFGFADDYELGAAIREHRHFDHSPGRYRKLQSGGRPQQTWFSGTVTIQCPVGLPLDVSCGLATGTASGSSGGASGSSGSTTLALTVAQGAPQNFTLALCDNGEKSGDSVATSASVAEIPDLRNRAVNSRGDCGPVRCLGESSAGRISSIRNRWRQLFAIQALLGWCWRPHSDFCGYGMRK